MRPKANDNYQGPIPQKAESLIQNAYSYLEYLLKDHKCREAQLKNTLNIFDNWMEKGECLFNVTNDDKEDYYCFVRCRQEKKEPSRLIGLWLLCASCSVASCERTISAQRLILTIRNLRLSKKVKDTRLTIFRSLEMHLHVLNV
ncbi:hypothetical protein TVAG_278740 [Trichomonas vaginalis G3]|uniref:Uncharacterized protein n=1 Tax=Trichomonas vaginalis (strain ATCC PRA-98 / G3) TaxID=412133 RepID=A2FXC3_TRIV3|nr:hypothetical protein TVAGG3_0103760 [Trichomonas vaginalis G3]EAX90453.1 hypothetical protein TVAG_278740 [Trichomonas vaginalis G3]KAI5544516.1 hypothetical protein TVAGG3_0103760 [Trichomonas vaginalis G3]|eukprot:XP_001303383.1 hypothetical protein [Trichomonas vaginalis G3]